MKRAPLVGYLFVLPALLVFVAFVAYPMVHTIVLSGYSWSPVNPVKVARGLGNYAELLADLTFSTALSNNAYFIILSLAVQLPGALLLAVALNSSLRRHHVLRTVFFAPFVVPVVAVGLVWQLIYEPNFGALNGLLDALGLGALTRGWLGQPDIAIFAIIAVSCWRYMGFHAMILLAGLQAIPDTLYEAARIDGAGRWQQFVHITIPSLSRILLVDALLITVGSVKIFDIVQVMTGGGPGYSSDVLATFMYKSAFSFDRMGYSAAIAVVMLVLTLALTVIYIRLTGSEQRQAPTPRWWPPLAVLLAILALTLVVRLTGWAPVARWLLFIVKVAVGLGLCLLVVKLLSDLCERLPERLVGVVRDVFVSVLAAIVALPILWALVSAFKPQNELLLAPWALPKHWAWGNFADAWAGGVGLFFLNSVLVTSVAVMLMLVLAAPAAYALARLRLWGAPAIFGLILAGLLVPVHSALLPLYELNNRLGITGYAAIMGPYVAFCIPLSVLLLRAYFSGVPRELSDAATIDGAGHLRILWSIFVPIARPAMATVAIFQAAWVWNELLFALVFLENKTQMTLPVGLLTFQGEHSTDWAIVMAGVVMAIVPVLVLYFVFQQHVVKGLTAGAVR
jgi:ABC-type sugar transport system permease subunit